MKKLILKYLILFAILMVPLLDSTNASYMDDETSYVNSFTAASLDFSLKDENATQMTSLFNEPKLKSDAEAVKIVKVVNEGSMPFYYFPKFVMTGGESSVCEKISLKAFKNSIEKYDGLLTDFDLSLSPILINSDTDVWEFQVKHENNEENLQGKKCIFDLVFDGYQNTSLSGFSDTERVGSTVGFSYKPGLSATHNKPLHKFIFTLSNLSNFTDFSYTLNYDTVTISDQVSGGESLSNQNSKTIDILLGTCSSGGNCTYQLNPHNFDLQVTLHDIDNDSITLSKQL